jgi:hypothetical protein
MARQQHTHPSRSSASCGRLKLNWGEEAPFSWFVRSGGLREAPAIGGDKNMAECVTSVTALPKSLTG